MSIASQLTALEGNISDAYDMVAQRGGTVPARKNMENLDDAIATIPSAGSPVFPMPMTSIVSGKLVCAGTATYTLPSAITDIGDGVFQNASMKNLWNDPYYGSSVTSAFDFSSLTTVSGTDAFYYAFESMYFDSGITSVSFDFSSLVTISGSGAFNSAWSYWSSNGPSLSVDFSSLANITASYAFQYAFTGNQLISSISFPSLSNLGNYTNQFNNMLYYCNDVAVHFPAALQSVIGSWADVQNGFGGTNTTVLFDL